MNTEMTNQERGTASSTEEIPDRRELIQSLGKFALYAAPFTVLAHTHKAQAATGSGPNPTPRLKP
jgi:hypothetical protein